MQLWAQSWCTVYTCSAHGVCLKRWLGRFLECSFEITNLLMRGLCFAAEDAEFDVCVCSANGARLEAVAVCCVGDDAIGCGHLDFGGRDRGMLDKVGQQQHQQPLQQHEQHQ